MIRRSRPIRPQARPRVEGLESRQLLATLHALAPNDPGIAPGATPITATPIVVTSPPTDVNPGGPAIGVVAPPADLAIAAPSVYANPQVGVTDTLVYTVRNNGAGVAEDAVVDLNLGVLPAGSTYSALLFAPSAGGTIPGANAPVTVARALTPVAGQAGVYRVDLGVIPAGGSVTFSLFLAPGGTQAFLLSATASDAGSTLADANPADNTVMVALDAAPALATGTLATASTVLVDFTTPLTRAQAQDLAHYQLTTATGATVRVRSASYDARHHRVTLHLAHPLPGATTSARLAIGGLGTAGGVTNLSLARRVTRHG